MAKTRAGAVDWANWLRRWDAQQTGYLPDRESRFAIMLDVLDVLLPERFVAIDLACGPGAISQRLLARFPDATSLAVDYDPVLLALGQGAVGTFDGRLRWIEADLADSGWANALGVESVEAVLSTTALHWLSAEALVCLYTTLGRLIRPGGVFLNGDHLRFGPHLDAFRRVSDTVKERRREAAFGQPDVEDWSEWWEALAREEPSLAELLAERDRRFGTRHHGAAAPGFDLHHAALLDAGFAQVDTIWQNLDNRVLLAVR